MTIEDLQTLHREAQALTSQAEAKARERNAALVLWVDAGTKSQAELARELGLTRQRLGALVSKGRNLAT